MNPDYDPNAFKEWLSTPDGMRYTKWFFSEDEEGKVMYQKAKEEVLKETKEPSSERPDLTKDDKDVIVQKAIEAAGHCLLMAFAACKLETHIVGEILNQADGKYYDLSFRVKPYVENEREKIQSLEQEIESLKKENIRLGDMTVSLGKVLLKPDEREKYEQKIERLREGKVELIKTVCAKCGGKLNETLDRSVCTECGYTS